MAKQYARLGAKALSFYSPILRFKLVPGEIKEFPDRAMMDNTFVTALSNGHIRIASPEEVEAYMEKMGQEAPTGIKVEKEEAAQILAELNTANEQIENLTNGMAEAAETVKRLTQENTILNARVELLSTGKEDCFAKQKRSLRITSLKLTSWRRKNKNLSRLYHLKRNVITLINSRKTLKKRLKRKSKLNTINMLSLDRVALVVNSVLLFKKS